MKPKKKKNTLPTPPKTPIKFHNAFFKGNSTT